MTLVPLDDIGIDRNGRVGIVAARSGQSLGVRAAERRAPKPPPNTNCVNFCNTKAGCGPINKECNPNTVSNCGCKAIE